MRETKLVSRQAVLAHCEKQFMLVGSLNTLSLPFVVQGSLEYPKYPNITASVLSSGGLEMLSATRGSCSFHSPEVWSNPAMQIAPQPETVAFTASGPVGFPKLKGRGEQLGKSHGNRLSREPKSRSQKTLISLQEIRELRRAFPRQIFLSWAFEPLFRASANTGLIPPSLGMKASSISKVPFTQFLKPGGTRNLTCRTAKS